MAMPNRLRTAFEHEMQLASDLYQQQQYSQCFYHLERAHVLGQRHYIPHVINHYWMMKVGIKRQDFKEILAQLLRIIGSVGSIIGWVPVGNTGGANVSAITPMPIPADLAQYFNEGETTDA